MDISKPKRDMDELIRRAQDKTALIVWGDASFISGLEQLTAALNTQAQLSQIGRIVVAYHNLLDHLCVRLRLIHYHAERPAVAEQQIRPPFYPRTAARLQQGQTHCASRPTTAIAGKNDAGISDNPRHRCASGVPEMPLGALSGCVHYIDPSAAWNSLVKRSCVCVTIAGSGREIFTGNTRILQTRLTWTLNRSSSGIAGA